jgi:hypothetical protein
LNGYIEIDEAAIQTRKRTEEEIIKNQKTSIKINDALAG